MELGAAYVRPRYAVREASFEKQACLSLVLPLFLVYRIQYFVEIHKRTNDARHMAKRSFTVVSARPYVTLLWSWLPLVVDPTPPT